MSNPKRISRFSILAAVLMIAAPVAGQTSQLVITGAVPNFDDAILTIVGSNFGNVAPVVRLGGFPLTVQTSTDTEIVAGLPPLVFGSYLLEVSKGTGASKRDGFVLTIGPGPAAGDITEVTAGSGLAGGGSSGHVTLEVDDGHLDGLYARTDGANSGHFARRDEPNNLTGDQVTDGNFDGRRIVANNGNDFENALHGVTWGLNATSVWGSNDSLDFGTGVHGRTSAPDGQGVWAETTSSAGVARALLAVANNPDGVAAVFRHNAGGQIISAGSAAGGEVFRLEQDGTVRASAYTDLAGNPIGSDGIGVFELQTGPGLVGGPIFGSGILELDFASLDASYARLEAENYFAETQHVPNLSAEFSVSAHDLAAAANVSGETAVFDTSVPGRTTLIVKQSATSDGNAISAEANGENQAAVSAHAGAPTGSNIALWGKVESPDATAAVLQNNADGRLLAAGTPTYGEVLSLGGDGRLNVSTPYTPGPGDQIFVLDVLATADSGHVRGVNSTVFSPQSAAVVGSSQPAVGGTGGSFDTYGDGGTGVWAGAQAPSGPGLALHAQQWSPDGVAGRFQNLGDGQILSGNSSSAEVFRVEGDGTVRASAYTDLLGNPVGSDGVGVFEVSTGAGLTGGPITGSGTLELDFGALDDQYARLNALNDFTSTNNFHGEVSFNGISQFSNRVQIAWASDPGNSAVAIGNLTDGAIGLQANASGPGSRGLVGFGDTGVQAGGFVGVSGFTGDPDGVGVLAEATAATGAGIALVAGSASPTGLSALLSSAGGRLLEGSAHQMATGNPESVLKFEADGSIVQHGFGSDLMIGNVWNGGTSSFDEVFRVAADGTLTATAVIETSSERFKTNVESLTGALAMVQSLRGVSFDWKRDGRRDIGVIAEEVAEILPEVVETADGEAQGVNYGRLTALLIEAVKEQQAQIERLEALVERLAAEQ